MTIEIAKLNKSIQKKLSSYLEAITEDFLEAYSTDNEAVKTLENAIICLKKVKHNLKEMHNLCLEAVPLDANEIKEKEQRFNHLLAQLDDVAEEARNGTTNLLKNHKLKVNLDDENTSGMVICGFDASALGLELHPADWPDVSNIKKSVKELNAANRVINQFLQKFNNYNLIIATWEEFIKNLINILRESALDSIMFDLDAEQANILALQTAQKMTRNSLLAANQTTQNILKLI